MIFVPLIIVLLIIVSINVTIVPQAKTYVIERLGTYQTTWNAGIHIKIPFLDRIARKVTLKEQVVDFEPQPVITKDNVTIVLPRICRLA